jgi:hypothetical protein
VQRIGQALMTSFCVVVIVLMLLTYASGIPGLETAGDFLGPLNLRSDS